MNMKLKRIPHVIQIMNEEDQHHFYQSLQEVIQSIIENIDPLFYHDYHFDDYLKSEAYVHFDSIVEEELFNTLYENRIESMFLETGLLKRSYVLSDARFDHTEDHSQQIQYLKSVPQPAQKSEEWYSFRKKHLTGSNIWKVFSTQSSINQLIYEKLAPNDSSSKRNSLSESPLNWGHKYEPLTCLFYEYYNDVVVEEFGCVPHKTIPFLAASPDGIVTSTKNNGRMVEIKNVVSREITKIPKMDYYIQMQLQMEVCNFPDCDFVETKFVEYESEREFWKDKYNLRKGMIIVLVKDNESFLYEYAPLFHNSEQEHNAFSKSIFEKYNLVCPQVESNGVRWFRNIYWKLDIYSCVYVPRNKVWFSKAFPKMKETWDIIEQEWTDSNSHLKYKPKSREKKEKKETTQPHIIEL